MSEQEYARLEKHISELQSAFDAHRESMRWVNGILITLMLLVCSASAWHFSLDYHPGMPNYINTKMSILEKGLRSEIAAVNKGELIAEMRANQNRLLQDSADIRIKLELLTAEISRSNNSN